MSEHITPDGRVFTLADGDAIVVTRDLRPGDAVSWCGMVDVVIAVDQSDDPMLRVDVQRTFDDTPQRAPRSALWFSHRDAEHHVVRRSVL